MMPPRIPSPFHAIHPPIPVAPPIEKPYPKNLHEWISHKSDNQETPQNPQQMAAPGAIHPAAFAMIREALAKAPMVKGPKHSMPVAQNTTARRVSSSPWGAIRPSENNETTNEKSDI